LSVKRRQGRSEAEGSVERVARTETWRALGGTERLPADIPKG
jgi:hypothetical protein